MVVIATIDHTQTVHNILAIRKRAWAAMAQSSLVYDPRLMWNTWLVTRFFNGFGDLHEIGGLEEGLEVIRRAARHALTLELPPEHGCTARFRGPRGGSMSAATPGDSVPFEVRCAAFPRGPADSLDPCSASAPTPLAPSPPPTGKASADLRLNAQKTGAFECSGGLFFTTSILNETTAPLRVDTLNITFTKVAGSACSNNAAPVDPQVGMSIPQGISTEIRRVDLAGQLCGPPVGAPGCEWLGKATLFTSFGVLTDEIGFRTVAPTASVPEPAPGPNSTTCGNDHPTVLSPEGGTTVSGTVAVTARLAPDELVCPISLRSFVKAVPSSGGRGGFSGYLDIAPDSYRWNTVSDPNGRYRITAQKACGTTLCGGISDPVTVAVSNP